MSRVIARALSITHRTKMAAGRTHTVRINGRTKAAEWECSIIQLKMRTGDKGRQGRKDKQHKDDSSGAGRECVCVGGGHSRKKGEEKKKRETYSIKNHVYFEKDDPFCWPCQLLAFQSVGFPFTILNLWERDMTAVCLAMPG